MKPNIRAIWTIAGSFVAVCTKSLCILSFPHDGNRLTVQWKLIGFNFPGHE